MNKWSYTILNVIFFVPVLLSLFFVYRKLIVRKLRFILLSGLLGIIYFFIVDPSAINWKAWQYNYSKTLGINFGKSVLEELIWVILVWMTVAKIIEIFLEKEELKK